MKKIASILVLATAQLAAGAVFAQATQPIGDGTGSVATTTKPATKAERTQARADRKVAGKAAAKADKVDGESYGSGTPAAATKVSKADRKAAGKARRADMAAANKAGELHVTGDNRVPDAAK